MKPITFLLSILFVIDLKSSGAQDAWTQKTDFGGTARYGAVGFSIGSKGYIGTGYGGSFKNDFWEYDPINNTWTQKADFGGTIREGAVGFSIGNKGYIGIGWLLDQNANYYSDFWEYNSSTNTWTQKTDFAGGNRIRAVGFSIGNKGYIGTGYYYDGSDHYYKDFWEYDPSTNSWTQKANFGGTARVAAVGFSIGDKGYIGTGGDDNNIKNDFWQYNPATNNWTQKANLGGTARAFAVGFSIGNKGYIGTGCCYLNDFWEYDTSFNFWIQKADFGGSGRYVAVGFSIDSQGYIGTGASTFFPSDFWQYTPGCNGGLTAYADADSDGYGDAGNSFFAADCVPPPGYVYDSSDCDDNNFTVNQYAPEICDGLDNNCDGLIDPLFTFYNDADGDDYGEISNHVIACNAPAGYLLDSSDCDDGNASIHPGAPEILNNGIDDNCDGTIDAQNTWTQKASFSGIKRYLATGFSIGSKGYIGTGYHSFNDHADFGEYDTSSNAWIQKASFGGGARSSAAGFSIGNKGYVGTGYHDGTWKDFWEYDPPTDSWTQKADFAGSARTGAVGFSIGNKGYIGTGEDGTGYTKDFWEYDPDINGWIQKAHFGGTKRRGAVGFSIDNKGYIGTGYDSAANYRNDFWEYDPVTDIWIQKANFGGTARWRAVGFSIGSKGYIGTGSANATYVNDFWEYNPPINSWLQKADFGGTVRDGAVGFSIGSKGYIGTGHMSDPNPHLYFDFWEYTPGCNGGIIVYADADSDGYGNLYNSSFTTDCTVPVGYVYNSSDCDDGNSNINPDVVEICDGIDNDCDGIIDPLSIFYADADGDNYGDISNHVLDCIAPASYVIDSTDCDDSNAAINPFATEICNSLDDDCNGTADNGLIFITYYADEDSDTYGDPYISIYSCTPLSGYVTNTSDCNDTNAAIHPGAIDICNGIDDNCDGVIDPLTTFYSDSDSDGYGNAANSVVGCVAPSGYVTNNTDCNDANAAVNSSSTEICDEIDNNCNGNIDEGLLETFYADNDGDTYGDVNNTILACTLPNGYVADINDCDDNNPNINPGALEIPGNGMDDNCNGYVDEFGVGVNEAASTSFFTIFPNPNNGIVALVATLQYEESITIKVLDLAGRELYSENLGNVNGSFTRQLDLSNFSRGTYLVQFIHNGHREVKKLSIEK